MARVENKVKKVIVAKIGCDPKKITPQARFKEDLGVGSLDTVELIIDIENAFKINIPDEQADKIQSVGEIIAYIKANPRVKKTAKAKAKEREREREGEY